MEGDEEAIWAHAGVSTDRIARTVGHPLRIRLLNLLLIRPGSAATDLARWSRQPRGVVRRQLKLLVDHGLVVVEHRERRRGVAENFYAPRSGLSAVAIDGTDALPRKALHRVIIGIMRSLVTGTAEALSGDTFVVRDDWVVANSQGEVDERGWRELAEMHRALLEKTQAVLANSRERLRAGDETPIYAISGQLLVEHPSLDSPCE